MINGVFHFRRLFPRFVIGLGLVALVLAAYVLSSPRRVARAGFWLNASREKGAFVFAGDSLIAKWTGLSLAFPGSRVANRGLDGDATSNLLDRLDRDILSLEPSGIVLMIGTNDLNSGNTPAEVVHNIGKILERVRMHSRSLPVVICKLAPRQPQPGLFPEKLREVNALLEKAFNSEPFTTLLDTWALFANERGEPNPADFPDGLHPSPQAYVKWGAALAPLVGKIRSTPAPAVASA